MVQNAGMSQCGKFVKVNVDKMEIRLSLSQSSTIPSRITGTSAPGNNTAVLPPQGELHHSTQSSHLAEAAAECVSSSLRSC